MANNTHRQPITGAFTNITKISDDLWIAIRSSQKRPTWYLYKVGTKFTQRSLGTTDRMKATQLALNAYHAYQEDPEGNWLGNTEVKKHNKDFKSVADEWLTTQDTDLINKKAVVRKFLVPFFHDGQKITSVSQIDAVMVEKYKRWRRAFWLTDEGSSEAEREARSGIKISQKQMENYCEAPSPNTLNREYPTLRQILKYAHKHGYFGKITPPDVSAEDSKANPRPAFLGGDFDKLMTEAEAWADEAETEKDEQRRRLLCDWDDDVDICGSMALTLDLVSVDRDEVNLFVGVRLIRDGHPIGFEGAFGFGLDMVARGCLKASMRALDAKHSVPWAPVHRFSARESLVPGSPVTLTIEVLPSATRFRAGDIFRLDLRGTPFFRRHPLLGQFPFGYEPSRPGTARVLVGGRRPAHLLVPLQTKA